VDRICTVRASCHESWEAVVSVLLSQPHLLAHLITGLLPCSQLMSMSVKMPLPDFIPVNTWALMAYGDATPHPLLLLPAGLWQLVH